MNSRKLQIAVVCTGNICRSPMAAALLSHALAAQPPPLNRVMVRSAGTSAFGGDAASDHAVRAMEKVGLDISSHRSAPFTLSLMEDSDLVLVMTDMHRELIRQAFPEDESPVHLFREWMGGKENQVPDPFGGSLSTYLETRDSLAEAIPPLIEFLKKFYADET